MNRYFSSFLITSTVHALVIGPILYLSNSNDKQVQVMQKEKRVVVHFTPAQTEKKSVEKTTSIKKVTPQKKEETQKKVCSKPKEKRAKKQVLQKQTTKKKILKKEKVYKEQAPIVKNVQKQIQAPEKKLENRTIQKIQNRSKTSTELKTAQELFKKQTKRKANQALFTKELVKKINENKSYPNMARRRGIQGVVNIRFQILENGEVKNIEIISGRSIFKKATIQAIKESFPIQVDPSLYNFPETFRVKIAYTLK